MGLGLGVGVGVGRVERVTRKKRRNLDTCQTPTPYPPSRTHVQMRCDDDYAYGGCYLHGPYDGEASSKSIAQDFLAFCLLAQRNGVVPAGWSWPECLKVAGSFVCFGKNFYCTRDDPLAARRNHSPATAVHHTQSVRKIRCSGEVGQRERVPSDDGRSQPPFYRGVRLRPSRAGTRNGGA